MGKRVTRTVSVESVNDLCTLLGVCGCVCLWNCVLLESVLTGIYS